MLRIRGRQSIHIEIGIISGKCYNAKENRVRGWKENTVAILNDLSHLSEVMAIVLSLGLR